ncbi:MAG: HK97 family phage prohead protease [Sulfitobacter sp.]
MTLEHKFAPLDADVDEKGRVEGYASKFGVEDQGGDIVVKSAFSKSLAVRLPKMLWQHDPSEPIGIWKEVKEDNTGLFVVGQINMDVQRGRETHSLIKSGAIDGMSIGYRTRKAVKTKSGARELSDLDLWEVSLVTFPMLLDATVQAKSLDDFDQPHEIKRFLEDHLRDAGFSVKQAKQGASLLAKDVLGERDAPGTSAEMAEELRQLIRGAITA